MRAITREPLASSPSERRVTARRACQLQVDYRAASDWRRATAMDVSVKGCRLRVGEDPGRGGVVSVRFAQTTADGSSLTATVDGSVVWVRREGLSYQAGIHFPGNSAELAAFIRALE